MKKGQFQKYLIALSILISGYLTVIYWRDVDHFLYSYLSIAVFSASIALLLIVLIKNRQSKLQRALENRLSMWDSITYRVRKAGETAFNELPVGIIVFNNHFDIDWANNYAKQIFMSPLVERNIENISGELYNILLKNIKSTTLNLYGQIYQIEYLPKDNIVYFTDVTEKIHLEEKYLNRTPAIGFLNLDNLEESMSLFDVQERADSMGKMIGVIGRWADRHNFYMRAYSEERYLIILNHQQLQKVIQEKFSVLDEIKSVFQNSDRGKVTLSIGIATADISMDDLSDLAMKQLELALDRGGDQAVIYSNGNTSFYGAKTVSAERKSRVEVRYKSNELRDRMLKASNVLVQGHKMLDADGFGACLAVFRIAQSLGKQSKIIIDLDQIDPTVTRIFEAIKTEHIGLLDDIITSKQAEKLIDANTLLMVVDTQNEYLVLEAKLLKKARQIGVIDHHRKGRNDIKNVSFSFTQTTFSSSVEAVLELASYFDQEIEFSAIEATWMLLGIIVDTNNFVYRTNARTFAVAAMLQYHGADMAMVKKYLKEDFYEKKIKNDYLNQMYVYEDIFGVSVSTTNDKIDRVILAKIADDIVMINHIEAGFAVGFIDENTIGISARSLDEINVQIIMENLGGGGHFNNAACQIKDSTLEDVKKRLEETLSNYLKEKESSMKVILTKDVKGRGKKGDVIELAPGFGNHLVRTGMAIMATSENLKKIESNKQAAVIEAEKHLNEMKALKELVEQKEIKIVVKVGKEGKLFGSVSTKQIIDTFEKETSILLDKRKILLEEPINALGTYLIPIQLHKEVVAKIKIFVVEKE